MKASISASPALPWLRGRLPSRWLDARRVKLARVGDTLNRALGLLCVVTRSGPSRAQPRFYRVLHRLGVLDHDPREARDAPRLDRLPWGAREVTAPAPSPPPEVTGMWPQEPVFHPEIYPAVLHLDRRESHAHVKANALRYLGQIVSLTPHAAWRARQKPRVWPLDDALFARILTETSLAQHLRATLHARDRAAFGAQLDGPVESYAKLDLSQVRPGPALARVHLAPTVTLFHRGTDGAYTARAIRVGDAVFTPSDGDAWALARYQVLSGIHVQHTVIVHPRLHFPGDVINAVSKSALPAGHLLARLIVPHTRISLGLNRAVTHHRRSVLYNSQREIYTPLPLETEGICAAVRVGRLGAEENDAYPAYDFWGIAHDPHTRFGQYCQDWQRAFEHFACAVTRNIPAGDPDVARWADAIHRWVPGFPDARAVFDGDNLGRAVGRYLATATVLHSADHHSYAAIPIEYLPMRILVPSPDQERPASLDLGRLVSAEDFFRHVLCHRMFFKPVVVESLDEVRYDFHERDAREAVRMFRDEWTRLDTRWEASGFPASYEIASGIQY